MLVEYKLCTHSCILYTFSSCSFGDTLLLLSSCRCEGVHPELPGVRGLLGVRLPVDVPVAPCSALSRVYVYVLRFRILCIRHFVINVINNIRTCFIISFYVICAVIYCSFCCIYMWLDPGTRIWLLGLCPFINRVLHYHIEMGTYVLIDLLGAGGPVAAAQPTSVDAP